ncbi:type II/IV secretion system protein [Paraburkholderia sp. UCT31]|nr:type II/IV secretion system protein [Paraburkholderia sp. UCT31]
MSFAEYLLNEKIVDKQIIEAALAEQKITNERLGLILLRGGFMTKATLLDIILKTNPGEIHKEFYYSVRVPAEVLTETKTMIVAEIDSTVYLSTLGSERVVRTSVSPYYRDMTLEFVACNHEKLDNYLEDLEKMVSNDSNLAERLIRRALRENVSDIHIMPRYASYSVFYRHLGVKHLAHEGSPDEYNILTSRIKDLAKMDLAERRVPQDGGYQIDYDGKLVDLRVATVPTVNGETVIIRLLDPDRVRPSLEGLGITRVSEWRKGVSRPNGLCLICGPTGSGKTTTLNASIREMDRFGQAIYSAEDPVEYRIPYVGQVNINASVGFDFARAIRAFMRADPDVIMLGEVRDVETARNAVKAAETGHLVVATLHTGSIYGAVQRLKDLDVPAYELRDLLRTVLVQRLMRTVCKHCHGDGCDHCGGGGYAGRTLVTECAYFSGEADVTRLLNGDIWWPTMMDDAILKFEEGITTKAEVVRCFGMEAEEIIDKRASERAKEIA